MTTKSFRECVVLSFLVSASLSACDPETAPEEDEEGAELAFREETGTTRRGGGGTFINNGLHDPQVGGFDETKPLSAGGFIGEALDHPDRLATAAYVVECALGPEQSVTTTIDGVEETFHGALGLATEWYGEACDKDCQQWVSACVLARTNVSEQEVTLWLQADHPAIGTDSNPAYPIYEASFFGNLFTGPGQEYMCPGLLVGPVFGQLDGRTCSNVLGGYCDFETYLACELGRCSFEGLLTPTAVDCRPGGLLLGSKMHTISTYVQPL